MQSPTRKDLLHLLAVHQGPVNESLLAHITAYLTEHFDVELIEATELAFGKSLSELRKIVRRGMPAEFSQVWGGKCLWLKNYMDATAKNEAPSIYHAMAALTCASIAMRRDFWVDMGFFQIFPPLATILVGPSGLRKTTAINTALKLLKDSKLRIIREKITPEALIEAIQPEDITQDATALLAAPEMSVTFGKAQYLQGFVPLITRLLDHDSVEQTTRGRGTIVVERIGFAILAGTTVPWIVEEMNASVISGGFTSRFLISYETSTPRIFYRTTNIDKQQLTILRTELHELCNAKGEIAISTMAGHLLEEWYTVHKNREDVGDLFSGYHQRKLTHIIRLAMIFSVLHGKRQIDRQQVFEAAELLKYVEPGMLNLYTELSRPTSAVDALAIVTYLKLAGRVPRVEMLRTLSQTIPVNRLKEALDFAIDSEQVRLIRNVHTDEIELVP